MEHGMMPSAAGVAAANEALREAAQWTQAQAPYALTAYDPISAMDNQILIQAPLPASGIESPSFKNERQPFSNLLDGLRVIGQAMNTFIIAETAQEIVIVDQHVAHERILYEYLCGLKGSSAIEKQALLVPQTLHLDRRSAVLLREKLDEVIRVGFNLRS